MELIKLIWKIEKNQQENYEKQQIAQKEIDYRYACDRIILDKLYDELNNIFNNYLKIKNENEQKVNSIKFMNYGKSSEIS